MIRIRLWRSTSLPVYQSTAYDKSTKFVTARGPKTPCAESLHELAVLGAGVVARGTVVKEGERGSESCPRPRLRVAEAGHNVGGPVAYVVADSTYLTPPLPALQLRWRQWHQ
jgi:hypothetical protein